MFGSLGAPELLIIGAIVLLIFGVGRLSGLGRDLGSSIKEFRKAVKDDDKEHAAAEAPQQQYTQVAPPPPVQAPPQQQVAPPPPPQQTTGDQKSPNIF